MSEKCFHCGDSVVGKPIIFEEKQFCCNGCKSVYEILSSNDLNNFYAFNEGSGIKPTEAVDHKYAVLDVPEIREGFIQFENDSIYQVTLFLPAIHCSSCIYLLENLQKITPDVVSSMANFTARTVQITANQSLKLSSLAQLLNNIGYAPELRPKDRLVQSASYDKKLLLKLGLAGFAFGSVMLWTFPEYLGLDETFLPFRNLSSFLTLLVAIPVFFYSAQDYFKSAYKGIRSRSLNLDIPIAIGIFVLFVNSAVSILMLDGPGYMDSFTGFVFFLLIGKWFQSKSYRSMSFDNDPKAYFPLGVHKKTENGEEILLIDQLKEGDRLEIYNEEVIPCDVMLLSPKAVINTSFITGESELVHLKTGDRIYAGSRIIGSSVEVEVKRTTDRSKFASIWNNHQQEKPNSLALNRENKLTKYFLTIVFIIATAGGISWFFIDATRVVDVVIAILVVACPCALALSFPFVYGNAMRKLGNHGFYFKNAYEVEKLKVIDHLAFDKTGTLTKDKTDGVIFSSELTQKQIDELFALTKQSVHPYSRSINQWLKPMVKNGCNIYDFQEQRGKGIQAKNEDGECLKLGNAVFTNMEDAFSGPIFTINDTLIGGFSFETQLRAGATELLAELENNYELAMLSGDQDTDAEKFKSIRKLQMFFKQSPKAKQQHIEEWQRNGKQVAYFGDGLNDSDALKTATLGVSVTDDVFRFTPSSDAIIKGDSLQKLPAFLRFGHHADKALKVCFGFSLLYNSVGMTFALLGYVTPLFAAILMPLSSITIVFMSTALIAFYRMK
jgi:Cu+-exporting ATPase